MRFYLIFIILIPLISASLKAQKIVIHPSRVITDVRHDLSPPLKAMAVLEPGYSIPSGRGGEIPNNSLPVAMQAQNPAVGTATETDPVIQERMGRQGPVNTILNFDGLYGTGSYAPPDPVGDVGLNHYIQAVNMSFAVYSKSGTLVYGPADLATLWQGFPGFHVSDGDPVVLFDHLADRWMISQFSLPNYPVAPFYEMIAISQTGDPLGSWYRYSFRFDEMPDYPKLGVWPDGYYFSAVSYTSYSLNWLGPLVAVIERDSMLEGKPARMICFQMDQNLHPLLPAELDGPAPPAGTPGYFLMASDETLGDTTDHLQLYQLHVDWSDTANTSFSGPEFIVTAPFDLNLCNGDPECIPQKGTTRKLDALSKYLMHRLQYRNFGTHESMVANHAVAAGDFNHAGIRWYELRKYNNNWSVFQQGTYAPDALHRWNGSIAMDGEGNIALGHSVSGENHYPSIGITGRKDGDSAGLMTYMEELAIAGTGSQTGLSRWGDYSSLNIDPADDATFWYTNEYFANMSYMNWKTRIATFTINSFQVGEVNPYPSGPENQVLSAYPNPFSTFVTFKWDMKGIGAVSIEISDINGRKLANMPFSRLSPGVHVFTADFSGMQEGVYICRFTCDGSVEIRRLIKAD